MTLLIYNYSYSFFRPWLNALEATSPRWFKNLESAVYSKFFFYRLYGTSKYYLRLNLVCSGCIFFQNVRKMHFFPMFRNGVKWHKCHIHQTRFAALRSLMCTYSVCSEFLFCVRTKSSASMALIKKKPKKKNPNNNNKTKHPPPQKK